MGGGINRGEKGRKEKVGGFPREGAHAKSELGRREEQREGREGGESVWVSKGERTHVNVGLGGGRGLGQS